MRGDGSDAVLRLGGVDSPFYDSLKWARKVKQAFANGLQQTIADLQQLCSEIVQLPDSGVPGQLKSTSTDHVSQVSGVLSKEAFYDESASLQTARHELAKQVETAVGELAKQQARARSAELIKWENLPNWADLLTEDRAWFAAEVDNLAVAVSGNIAGLRRLLAYEYDLNHRLRELDKELGVLAAKRRDEREKPPEEGNGNTREPVDAEIIVPAVIERVDQLEALVAQIQALRVRLAARQPVHICWKEQTKS